MPELERREYWLHFDMLNKKDALLGAPFHTSKQAERTNF